VENSLVSFLALVDYYPTETTLFGFFYKLVDCQQKRDTLSGMYYFIAVPVGERELCCSRSIFAELAKVSLLETDLLLTALPQFLLQLLQHC